VPYNHSRKIKPSLDIYNINTNDVNMLSLI
jgi:hypothetical protein